MTVKILLAVLLVASLAACGDGPPEVPAEARAVVPEAPFEHCAKAVRIYRDLQSPVVIMGQSVKTLEGTMGVEIVEIEYEGTDAMNLPVKGSAKCTFIVSALRLLVVDGSSVDQQETDSIRGKL